MLGDVDHVFVSFENDAELREVAASYLEKGIERGELVVYASKGGEEDIHRSLNEAGLANDLLASDQLVVAPLDRVYATAEARSPREALASSLGEYLDTVSARKLSGLQVFAVSTPLAAFPEWGRWELEMGRRAATGHLTAVCAYEARAVEHHMLRDLASLHCVLRSERPVTSFCFYPTDQGLALTGEIDATSADRLRRILSHLESAPESPIVVDVSELTFINHDGLLILEAFARSRERQVCLVGASSTVRRLHDILSLDEAVLQVKP